MKYFQNFEDVTLPALNGVEFKRCLRQEGWCVGDNGTILSCLRRGPRMGNYPRFKDEWKYIKTHPNPDGYAKASYSDHYSKYYKTICVHIIVLESFVGPCPFPGAIGRHLNDDKSNNCLYNLEWGTHIENMEDAKRNGKIRTGEYHQNSILTEDQVIEARNLRNSGWKTADIHRMFLKKYNIPIEYQQFNLAVIGKSWKYLDKLVTVNKKKRITLEQVLEAKKLKDSGLQYFEIHKVLADKYGPELSYDQVRLALNGRTWKHLNDPEF